MKINFETIRQAREISKKVTRRGTFQWLEAGAEDNLTTIANEKFLNSIKFVPRMLMKNNRLNINSNFLNKKIASPLILCPMGHQTQFSKYGEIETCKGVLSSNSVSFFSTQGRHSLDVIRKKNPKAILAWQFFLFGKKDWILSQIRNAEKNKCLALSICLDAPVRSHRYLDREVNYDARKYGNRTQPLPPDVTKALEYDWEIIRWIKKKTSLPLILKGIMNEKDASLAKKYGSNILWVSNHGGRMVNSGISSGEALLKIRQQLGPKIKIIVDGGVRRGSDIAKYLSMGANYVGIGRPAMYGLTIGGSNGVKKIFSILNNEFYTFMQNSGCRQINDLKLNKLIFPKTF